MRHAAVRILPFPLRFSRRIALTTHQRLHSLDHSACYNRTSRTIHNCRGCGYVSNWKLNLNRHLKKNQPESEKHRPENQPINFNQCEPRSTHRSRQQSISRGTSKRGTSKMEQDDLEAKIVGKQCEASLKFQSELLRTLEKPFQCEFCDQGFNWKSNLTRHQKTQHVGTKPIPCGQCDRRFFTKRQLNRHTKSHSEVADLDPPERKYLRSQKRIAKMTSPPRREIGTDDLTDESKPSELLCDDGMPVKPLKTPTRIHRYESIDEDELVKMNDPSVIRSADPYLYSCESSDDDLMMHVLQKYRSADLVAKHGKINDPDRTIAQLSRDQYFGRTISDDDRMINQIPQTDPTESNGANVKRRGRKRKSFALGKDPILNNIKQEPVDVDDNVLLMSMTSPVQQKKTRRSCKVDGYSNLQPVVTLSDDDDGKHVVGNSSFSSIFNESSKDSDQDEGPFTPRQSAKTLNRMSLKRSGGVVDPDPDRLIKKYPCSFCDREFNRLSSHLQHERSHLRKPVFCNFCGKRFERQSVLDKHTLIHTSKKTYKCGYCLQGFKRKSTLQRHMEVHGFGGKDADDYQSFLTGDSLEVPMFILEDTESGNDSDYYRGSRKETLQGNSGSHTYNTRFASKQESCRSDVQDDPGCTGSAESAEKDEDPTRKSSYGKDSGDKVGSFKNRDQEQSMDREDQTHSMNETDSCSYNWVGEVSKSEIKDCLPVTPQSQGKSLESTKTGDALTNLGNDVDVSQCAKNLMIIRLNSKNNTIRFNKSKEIVSPKKSFASIASSRTKLIEDLSKRNVSISISTAEKMEEKNESSVAEMSSTKDTNIKVAKGVPIITEGLVDPNCGDSNEITGDISSHSSLKKLKETCKNPVVKSSMNNVNIGNAESIPNDASNKNGFPAFKKCISDEVDDKMDDSEVDVHQTLKKEEEISENNVGATLATGIENQGTNCISIDGMRMKEEPDSSNSSNSTKKVSPEESYINLTSEDAGDDKQDESILTDIKAMVTKIIESILIEPENMCYEFRELKDKESEETTGMRKDKLEEAEENNMEDEAEEDKMGDEAEEDKMGDVAEEDNMEDVAEEDKMGDEAEEDKMGDEAEEDKMEDIAEEDKMGDVAEEDKMMDRDEEDKMRDGNKENKMIDEKDKTKAEEDMTKAEEEKLKDEDEMKNGAEEDKVEDGDAREEDALKEKEPAAPILSNLDVNNESVKEFLETVLLENFEETTCNEDSVMIDSSVIDGKCDTDLELDQITPSLVQTVEEAKQNETIYDDLELVKFEEIETEGLEQVYDDDAIRKPCQDTTVGNRRSLSGLIKPSQKNEVETNTRDDFVLSKNDGYCEIESVTPLLSLTETLEQNRNASVLDMEWENLEEVDADKKVLGKNDQDKNVIDDHQGEGCKQTEKEDEFLSISANLITGNLADDHDLIINGLRSNLIQCEEISTTDSAIPDEDLSLQAKETAIGKPTIVHEMDKESNGKETDFQTVQGVLESMDESVRSTSPNLDKNSKTESCALLQSDSFQSSSKKIAVDSPHVKNRKSEPPKKRGPKPGSSRKRKRRVPEIDNLLNPFNDISIEEDGDFRAQKILRSGRLLAKEIDRFGVKNECVFNAIDTLALPAGIKQEDQRFPNGYEKISIRQNIMVEQLIERVDTPRNHDQLQFGLAAALPLDGFGWRGVQRKDQQMRSDRVQNPCYTFNFGPPSCTPLQNDQRSNILPPFNSLRDWKVPKTEEKELVFSSSVTPGFQEIRNRGMNPSINIGTYRGFVNRPGKQPDERDGFLVQQFECNKCDRSFERKEDMIRHRFTEHEKNCF